MLTFIVNRRLHIELVVYRIVPEAYHGNGGIKYPTMIMVTSDTLIILCYKARQPLLCSWVNQLDTDRKSDCVSETGNCYQYFNVELVQRLFPSETSFHHNKVFSHKSEETHITKNIVQRKCCR